MRSPDLTFSTTAPFEATTNVTLGCSRTTAGTAEAGLPVQGTKGIRCSKSQSKSSRLRALTSLSEVMSQKTIAGTDTTWPNARRCFCRRDRPGRSCRRDG